MSELAEKLGFLKLFRPIWSVKLWLVPLILSLFLIALTQQDYLIFHVLAEFFAVVISFILFAVAWQTYEFSKNFFLLFIACAYFWLGALDLAHALTYKGMGIIVQNDSNTATQFWIATRYMEAAFLLAAPFVAYKSLNRFAVFIFPGLIATTLSLLILAGTFPTVFIEGQGLTPVKIYSEYIIIAMLAAAIIALIRRPVPLRDDNRLLIALAIALTIGAELCFTLYADLYGIFNVVGHIFKLCSYWVLYQATVSASLTDPHLELLARHEELQAQQARLNMLSNAINQTPISILITDARGYILFANPKFEAITGYSAGEVIGRHPQLLRSEQTLKADYENLWATIFSGKQWQGELQNKRKDGAIYWESMMISPVIDDDGDITHFLSISEDITARKQMESEATRFGRIIEKSLGEIYTYDAKTLCFTQVNQGARTNLGYSPEELRQLTAVDIVPLLSEQSFDKLLQPLREGTTEEVTFTTLHERKDGTSYDAEFHVQLMGEETPPVFVANAKDVTKQKRLEEQLRQAQKMEAVGQITGGIAHDFNNILAIVMGNLEFLQEIIEGNSKAEECIDGALSGTKRGAALTQKLLGFTRQQDSKTRSVDLNDLIQNMAPLIAKSITASVQIEHDFSDKLWPVDIDPQDFENAILNLSLNGRDAMLEGGKLTVETKNQTLDEEFAAGTAGVQCGDYVVVSVSDTGSGMSVSTQEKALDPFYTTKEPGKGTGLGLSMVYGFVRRSKGHMQIYSEIDQGTTIRMFLPRSIENEKATSGNRNNRFSVPRGSETVLIVDDEPALQQLAAAHLQKLGYSVHTAGSGVEALEILQTHSEIQLLFSDIIMPGKMDGYRLAAAALSLYPGLKVLLATGFAGKRKLGDDAGDDLRKLFEEHMLKKPYNKSELACAVRNALEHQN